MSEYQRGSEWRRWDLHVHTPGTIKNDKYTGSSIEEKWNTFYTDITTYIGDGTDIARNVVALGITDYLSVENYKKVLIDNRLPATVKLVLPNVEMRMYPLSKQSGINIHFLFDPAIVNDLDDRFFSQMSITYGGRTYTATKSQLIQLGRAVSSSVVDEDDAYKIGVGQFIPSFDSIKSIFDKDADLREKVIIVVSNGSNDGVTGAANHSCYFDSSSHVSDFDATRQAIYQFADAIFSANKNDIDYFLGKRADSPDKVIQKCGSLMPCIHGCDAHENSKIFEPDQKRYCWIKADPTFNGLKQVLYEPEQRVRISELIPEQKPDYYVIDRIEFKDTDFQTQPVVFNDKLTCIIGGKSTGKSILLHNLALAIDKKQVEEKISITNTNTKVVDKLKVYWADGSISSDASNDTIHKIVYIPQTYLNRLTDEKEEKTEIDSIIENIVLNNQVVKKVYEETKEAIKAYKPELDKAIYDLLEKHRELGEIDSKRKELGNKPGIEAEINKLRAQKEQLSKALSLSENDIKSYDEAVSKVSQLTRQITDLTNEIDNINAISSLVVAKDIDYPFSKNTMTEINQVISKAIEAANEVWLSAKKTIIENINVIKLQKEKELSGYIQTQESLHDRVQGNKAIIELTDKIKLESEKLGKLIEMDNQFKEISKRANVLLEQVVDSMAFYAKQHKKYADAVNGNTDLSTDDLVFSVGYPFRKEAFLEKLKHIIDNRTLKKIINLDDFSAEDYSKQNVYSIVTKILSGELPLVKNNTVESALRIILADWYNTTYSVKMDGDTIDVMSPGKKALVLLKLLISLANSKCPILIDQPEDDLDNRSIFDDLIPFIKSKKKDRQIIVVTHNANIVLGSDAEEVIIANQNGKNSPNKEYRFEYRSGSIEDDKPVMGADGSPESGILNSQGVQQHICDILEGGKKAFDLRKQKYRI